MNPQNPYSSYLVNASAGSGKTYQLSHRFLCLVACGAVPDSILTITFTKKAAKEMRQRILQLASLLAHNAPLAEQFDDKVAAFYREELHRRAEENTAMASESEAPEFRPPRSARETAREVLAASQRLRVVTIDSIFLNWRSRFAYEASGGNDPGRKMMVADPWLVEQLKTRSFAAAFRDLTSQDLTNQEPQQAQDKPLTPLEQWGRIDKLWTLESFLWLMSRGEDSPFGDWPIAHYGEASACASYEDWFARHLDEINELVTALGGNKLAERLEALHSDQAVSRLRAMRFLKGEGLISGSVVRKADLKPTMEAINASLAVYGNYRSIVELNRQQQGLATLFAKTQTSWQVHKRRAGVLDFGDAAKGCHNLFHDREYDSARFYLQQHIVHIMIDEFQDTNLLQWGIFREMAHEILAGYDPKDSEYALRPSVFLVGDPKQSIYRFREAEAGILADVPQQLPDSGIASVVLSASYRSCPTILDFVNRFFAEKMTDFPEHQAAQIDGKTLKSDCSEVLVVEPFVVSDKATKAKAKAPTEDERTEAEWVAEDIAARLAEPWRYPVAEGKGYRALRPGDCAILVRANKAVLPMSRALRSLGVSASPTLSQNAGVLAKAEGLDALAVIKVLAFPRDELAWLSLLKSPLVGIPEAQLWPALTDTEGGARQPHRSGHDLLTALLPHIPHQPLRKLLATMSARPDALTPSAVLSQLVNTAESSYRGAFGAEEAEVAMRQYRVLIHTLTSIERQWGTSPTIVYHRLLEWDQQQQIPAVSSSSEGVQIMTIHKAKGLEFPLVYATNCHEPWERSDSYWLKSTAEGKVYYIGIKDSQPKGDPTFDRLMAAEKQAEVDENLRLFYVAITRASQYLVISGEGKKPEKGYHLDHALDVAAGFESREVAGQPCRALTGADLESGRTASTSMQDNREEPRAQHSPLLQFEPSQEPAFVPEVAILAPSRLLSDDEGEDDGKGEGAIKPEQSRSAGRLPIHWTHAEGTFIHNLLEQYFLAGGAGSGDSDDFADLYPKHFPHGSESHREVLSQYWSNLRAFPSFAQLTEGADEVLPELPLCYLAGQTLINGSLDLVVVRGDAVTIIDFKTGQHVATGQEAAHCKARGYDRQLALYKTGLTRLWPQKAVATEVFLTTTGVRVPLGEV